MQKILSLRNTSQQLLSKKKKNQSSVMYFPMIYVAPIISILAEALTSQL